MLIFNSSRAHVEKEDQGGQQEKLDQRWVTYLLSLFCLFVQWLSFNFSFGLGRVILEMTAHQDLQGRGFVPQYHHYEFPFYLIIEQ